MADDPRDPRHVLVLLEDSRTLGLAPTLALMNNYAWHGRHHTAQIRWMRLHRLGLTD